MAGKFSVEGVFKMNDAMTGPIAKIEGRFERLQRRVSSSMSGLASGAGKAWGATEKWASGVAARAKPLAALGGDLKQVGVAAAAAGAAAGAGLVSVMRTGMDFEKTLLDAGNKFEPGIEKNSELFKKLSKAAQDVGGATEFSSSQAAVALNDLAGAGFDADQAIAGLPKVVDFATASSIDLAEASDIAAKALGAYGMKSKDPIELAKNLERVTNVLSKADDISSTNIPALFEVLKEGGPVAKTAGVSLEEFATLAAALGEAGIEGSVGGTTLKNMILTMSAPTNEAAAAFKRFGIQLKGANGDLRSPIEILDELQKATAKLGTADKAGVIEEIFGKIPIAGVSSLLDKVDDLRTGKTAIENSGGAVEKKATSKRQSTQGSWDNLTSGIEAVSLSIFEVVGGPMKDMIDGTTDWIGTFKSDAIPAVTEFVSGLKAGFAEAWPAIKSVIDMLFKGFGGKAEWMGDVRDFAVLLGKVTAGAVLLGATLGGMLAAGLQIAVALVNEGIGVWNGMIGAIGGALFAVSDFFANVSAKWEAFSFADWGKRMMEGLVDGIKNGAKWVMDALQGLADKMINKIKSALMIQSPSKRTAQLGKFAAMGVGDGWKAQMPKVDEQIRRTLDVSTMVQPLARSPILQAPNFSRWELPPINALPLGSDAAPMVARPQPEIAGAAGASNARPGRDQLEITVRAADGAGAEVTKKPKNALITLKLPNSGDL